MFEHCDHHDHVDVPVPPCSAPIPKGTRVPAGGKTGQVLAKHSDVDGDTYWITPVSMEEVAEAIADALGAVSAALDSINGEVV